MSTGGAYVWILSSRPEDLRRSDFEDESEWPLLRNEVRLLLTALVRRNMESEDLAIWVADNLATKLGGVILWNGMDE